MQLQQYSDASLCYRQMLPQLSKKEAQNNLCIGILASGATSKASSTWFMAVVKDEAGIPVLFALQTPPFNIILAAISEDKAQICEATLCLAEHIKKQGQPLPGVIGPDGAAIDFFAAWQGFAHKEENLAFQQGIYVLRAVNDVPIIGAMRFAEEKDLYFAPYWLFAMEQESGVVMEDFAGVVKQTKSLIAKKSLAILEAEGTPVSIAALARKLPSGHAVSYVYSPPMFRGRGYATSCVAQLSAYALAQGDDYLVLHTDLANPTSNDIYKKIGYVQVDTMLELRF